MVVRVACSFAANTAAGTEEGSRVRVSIIDCTRNLPHHSGVDAELKSSLTRDRLRLLTIVSIALSCVLSILATLRGGYVGPDYNTHVARLIEWPKIFDFGSTNPPLYYLLAHALFLVIGSNNVLLITVSIIQILINAVSMWFFFRVTSSSDSLLEEFT